MESKRQGRSGAAGSTVVELLDELAYNLRWSWNDAATGIFRDLDPSLWHETRHNPVALLGRLGTDAVAERTLDDAFAARVVAAVEDLRAYLAAEDTWYARSYGEPPGAGPPLVAYFSAEFGITECLSIYAGGLGVLSGDHLKSASDLGIPLVGVGMLYREGYFRQTLTAEGAQEAAFPRLDVDALPVRAVERPDGDPLTVAIPFPGRQVFARVWRAQVGRVPLYLLDTDAPGNAAADRGITARLYGGDEETRIQQELVLGIGGYRALEALRIAPRAFHMNEGHSAFLALEHVRRLMAGGGLSFDEAVEAVSARTVFTTHTPVPAGHDRFAPALMERYLGGRTHGFDLSLERLMRLGREDPTDADEPFCMTVLALRLADHRNGVSRIHGAISRRMWAGLWPDRAEPDVPIAHITNGVHMPTWLAPEIAALHGRSMEPDGSADRAAIPGDALWDAHGRCKSRLIAFTRDRLRAQLARQGLDETVADTVLDPGALTIVFARRFATYKRATLLLEDEDRLDALLNDAAHPVQVIYAGKAHPRDRLGQALIRRIARLASSVRFRERLVFLENYDLDVARHLVQGADIWLNNPRKPMEASGTSGMKAAANGVLNLSVLDGWWDEAWEMAQEAGTPIGWAIPDGPRKKTALAAIDAADAGHLHRILAEEVVPAFYTRDEGGRPTDWLQRMEAAVRIVTPAFDADRMVRQYIERYDRAAVDADGTGAALSSTG